jgi:exodeoxyribonuclease I
MATTYLFYDLETSGLNPAFDQILQFAAIRTDEGFKELDRYELRIRLRPDVVPSPRALLITGISIQEAKTGLCEYEAVRQIHALVNEPNTISLGYNSLAFDDQFLRFSFYRNLLPPYEHQWKNGCDRLDIMAITLLYWLEQSPVINWPAVDEQPTLKLEHLKECNDLVAGVAHDATVDVAATLELARRLRSDSTAWADSLTHFEKNQFAGQLGCLPKYAGRPCAILAHHSIGYEHGCVVPVLFLGGSKSRKNHTWWLWLDSELISQTTLEDIGGTTRASCKKAGEPPFLLSPKKYELGPERRVLTKQNMEWLKQNGDVLDQIVHHYCHDQSSANDNLDTDAALYVVGFASKEDATLCRQFHLADISRKVTLRDRFSAPHYGGLIALLLGRNECFGHCLPEYDAYLHDVWRGARPQTDYRDKPRLTPTAALAEIAEIRQNEPLSADQQTILTDLEHYLRRRAVPVEEAP